MPFINEKLCRILNIKVVLYIQVPAWFIKKRAWPFRNSWSKNITLQGSTQNCWIHSSPLSWYVQLSGSHSNADFYFYNLVTNPVQRCWRFHCQVSAGLKYFLQGPTLWFKERTPCGKFKEYRVFEKFSSDKINLWTVSL